MGPFRDILTIIHIHPEFLALRHLQCVRSMGPNSVGIRPQMVMSVSLRTFHWMRDDPYHDGQI